VLPFEEFSFWKGGNRYNTWCKACIALAQLDRGRHNKGKINKPKLLIERARRAALGTAVLAYLEEHPCVDCGEKDPVVLDFDHVRGEKRMSVTRMISLQYSSKTLFDEIAKCDVRCSNCHRRKTAKAQNWSRLRNYIPKSL
jgi:hypothetical protein